MFGVVYSVTLQEETMTMVMWLTISSTCRYINTVVRQSEKNKPPRVGNKKMEGRREYIKHRER